MNWAFVQMLPQVFLGDELGAGQGDRDEVQVGFAGRRRGSSVRSDGKARRLKPEVKRNLSLGLKGSRLQFSSW